MSVCDERDPCPACAGQEPGPCEATLRCLEESDDCKGPVLMRWPGYGERHWPRCEFHGDRRVQREEESIARNGHPDSPCPPPGFDPMDAGERWDEDDPW